MPPADHWMGLVFLKPGTFRLNVTVRVLNVRALFGALPLNVRARVGPSIKG